jgi:hypothetical protein
VSLAIGFAAGLMVIARGVNIEPPRMITDAITALTARFARASP